MIDSDDEVPEKDRLFDEGDNDEGTDDLIDNSIQDIIGKQKIQEQLFKVQDELFVIPVTRRPFFPGMAAPLVIEKGPYYEVLKIVAKSTHKALLLVLTRKEEADIYNVDFDEIHRVGVVATVLRIVPMEEGGAQVVLNMEERAEILKPVAKSKYLRAKVDFHHEVTREEESKLIKAYSISIITTIKELLKLNPLFKEELQIFLGHSDFTEPGKLADFAVALTTASREDLQDILETFDLEKRIDKTLVLLRKELDLSKLQSSINQKIEATISKTQREFFLREQLKTIKKELGLEKDDKTCDREKFEKRLKDKKVPKDVRKVIDEELEKLNVLEVQSAEYAVCRNYLDWLTILPWGKFSKENHSISHAEKVLARDHYGLKDVKERILEFIGVGALTGGVKGSIICFVGPPGVGKTSIGKSIANALNREFFRFSVGGMRDEAEIKGHRRTYVGAMPGKMIQALKAAQTQNPVVMIDEVDKMGSSYQGDPASALLEVLDPEQNIDFLDHFLDVNVDLSNVLFIMTANVLDTVPSALKDRMDIIRLSGYIKEEKYHIAKKYLIPKGTKACGLGEKGIKFAPAALRLIIENYSREAGVRGLEKNLKKIMRKIAVEIARDSEKKKRKMVVRTKDVTEKQIEHYLGKPIFTSDRYYDQTPVGVASGLAWTSMGGATLYVEAIEIPSEKTKMQLTGQAGDVMKESAQIAWSYVGGEITSLVPGVHFFERKDVHIHIPEGATPKDGPSAGITMVTALVSLLTQRPIVKDLGMTGEITLTGKVLPIGGVKEKLIAARRSGLKQIIFPLENKRDYEELEAYLKKGLKVHFVNRYAEVMRISFPHSKVKRKTQSKRKGRMK